MYRFVCVINLSNISIGFACLNCFTRKEKKSILSRDMDKENKIDCIIFDLIYWV